MRAGPSVIEMSVDRIQRQTAWPRQRNRYYRIANRPLAESVRSPTSPSSLASEPLVRLLVRPKFPDTIEGLRGYVWYWLHSLGRITVLCAENE